MKTLPWIILILISAGCATEERLTYGDVDPWLEGVARREPVEEASYPYHPPENRFPVEYDEEFAAIREIDVPDETPFFEENVFDRGRASSRADSYDAEYDYAYDADGIWYGEDYYPGGVFMAGDYEDGYFADDGFHVPGGIIVGPGVIEECRRLHPDERPPRRYRGHRGRGQTGYDEVREARGRTRTPSPPDRTGPARTNPGTETRIGTPPTTPVPRRRPTAESPRVGRKGPTVPEKQKAPRRKPRARQKPNGEKRMTDDR
jgi:hypothetical protein